MVEKLEPEDIHPRAILRFTAILVVIALAAALAMKFMFDALLARARSADPPPPLLAEAAEPRLPPLPRLQTAPEAELGAMRVEEEERLTTYGWVDRQAGVVRIPIERAIAIMVERAERVSDAQQ